MRYLLILVVAAFAGCGGSSDDRAVYDKDAANEMETAADELQESIGTSMQKAEDVEQQLQDAADRRNDAVDEASGNQG